MTHLRTRIVLMAFLVSLGYPGASFGDEIVPIGRILANPPLFATDVGPLSRQFLTRAEGFFGDRFSLTLCNKLIRCQVPE